MVMVIEAIKRVWSLEGGGITLGCDGENALYEALDYTKKSTSCNQQQYDLLSGIQGYIRDSSVNYTPVWIKGHQDDNVKIEDLGRLAMLNVEVDLYAKLFWADKVKINQSGVQKYFQYRVPEGMWKIAVLGTRVTNHLSQYLRESIEGTGVAEYWIHKKKRFSEEGYFQVDWDANKEAMKSVPVSRRHWVTKFESGMCGTGRMMKIWKQRLLDNCPRCGAPNETPQHILTCTSDAAIGVWNQSMEKLEEWLSANKTCLDVKSLLLQIMNQWREGDRVTNLRDYEFDGIEDVFRNQQQIGWRQLMGGCLSLEWARVQDTYFKWLGLRRTGKRWVEALITKLWDVCWDQWESRNEALHRTPIAADMSGAVSLNRAIAAECQ